MSNKNVGSNVFVVGDPNNGKVNFIKRFLNFCPPSAEMKRKDKAIYSLFNLDRQLRIILHDVVNVETIEQESNVEIEMVFFCYAANDPESLQSLEKWIRLMKVGEKGIQSFLVADMSNLGSQQHIAKSLSEQAKKLTVNFGIKCFIECCFDDERAYDEVFSRIFPVSRNNSKESSTVSGEIGDESSTVSGEIGDESSTVSGESGDESSTVSGESGEESSTVSGESGEESSPLYINIGNHSSPLYINMGNDSSLVSRNIGNDSSLVSRNIGMDSSPVSRNIGNESSRVSFYDLDQLVASFQQIGLDSPSCSRNSINESSPCSRNSSNDSSPVFRNSDNKSSPVSRKRGNQSPPVIQDIDSAPLAKRNRF